MTSRRTPRSRARGAALLIAILYGAVALTVSLLTLEIVAANRRHVIATGAKARAAAIAEAGLDEALRTIARGAPADAEQAFAGGSYTATITDRGAGVYGITAKGQYGEGAAVIQAVAEQSGASVVIHSWKRVK